MPPRAYNNYKRAFCQVMFVSACRITHQSHQTDEKEVIHEIFAKIENRSTLRA